MMNSARSESDRKTRSSVYTLTQLVRKYGKAGGLLLGDVPKGYDESTEGSSLCRSYSLGLMTKALRGLRLCRGYSLGLLWCSDWPITRSDITIQSRFWLCLGGPGTLTKIYDIQIQICKKPIFGGLEKIWTHPWVTVLVGLAVMQGHSPDVAD